jgi:hypothetical protein
MTLGMQPKHEEIYHVDNLVLVFLWSAGAYWKGSERCKNELGPVKQGFQRGACSW